MLYLNYSTSIASQLSNAVRASKNFERSLIFILIIDELK